MKPLLLLVFLALQITVPHFNEVVEHTFDGDARLLCVADLDSNGTQEILTWDSVTREVICYNCTGSTLWTLPVEYPLMTAAAEDLDDNGSKEIVLLEELGGDTYYSYRIMRIEQDGTVSWRKLIETNISAEFEFHFINADGKPGKEIAAANRILLGGGLERLAFERDRIIIGTAELDGAPYFLVETPAGYELYTFDTEPVWQGQPCEINTEAMESLLCTLFFNAGVCSCFEDWTFTESAPPMKSVRLWSDITGNGTEEALFFTDSSVQLLDSQGETLWTWESPHPIQTLHILDMTKDGSSEIVVEPISRGVHVPSLYVLDSTGELQSAFALNLSGTSTVVFSDLDGDTDPDLLTFDRREKKSTLSIYTNTVKKGQLDNLEPLRSLEIVDPSSFQTKFWTFYAQYRILAGIALAVIVGILFIMIRRRTK